MALSWSTTARFTGIGTLCMLVAFSAVLASHAYGSSKEVGAGAAQGELGFFMVLMVASPVVLLLTGASWWLGRRGAEAERNSTMRLANLLGTASMLGLCWNWVYLLAVWRA